MDGISIAASIISIATAGIQISIKLVTLSTQISSASERVSSIGNDVSLTSGVLHQLGELMTQKATGDGVSIFSQGGLETTRTSANMCERIFREIENEFRRANAQLRGCRKSAGGQIKLSKSEQLKWPFLQPSIDILRADLREAKGTLMLMLQVTSLALSKKMADLSASASSEQSDIFRAIIALQQQQDRSKKEGSDAKKDLSSGSIGGVPSTSSLVSHQSHVRVSHHPSSQTTNHRPDGGTVTKVTAIVPRPAEKLAEDNEFSSNASLESSISFLDRTNTNISAQAMDDSSTYEILDGNGELLDEQMKDSHLEQQEKKRSITSNQYRAESQASAIPKEPTLTSELGSELRMFMLKPIVKDYFNKIELTWSVQSPRVHVSTIRKHLAHMEESGLPSVVDMLETLYDYEHSMIDTYQGQGELLSLKRTKTDIQHRDITFKGVPGLQFVVEPSEISQASNDPRGKLTVRSDGLSPEDETRRKDEGAGVQGLLLNEYGLVMGEKGYPVAELVVGDIRKVAGRPLNANLQVVDDFDYVIGCCKLITEKPSEILGQGPFAGLGDIFVVPAGVVKDREGNVVGWVVEGDPEELLGFSVKGNGDIVDGYGDYQGRAEPNEEPEKENDSIVKADNPSFDENRRERPATMPHDPGVARGDQSPGEERSMYQELRTMNSEIEKTCREEHAEGEDHEEYEQELRARLDELQCANLDSKYRELQDAEKTELYERRPLRKRAKKALILSNVAEPPSSRQSPSYEREQDRPFYRGEVLNNPEDSKKISGAPKLKTEHTSVTSDANETAPFEIFKSFRVDLEQTVEKILPAALRKYNISADPSDYAIYVTYEDKELCLGRQDKPLPIFKQLDKEGRKPAFLLRRHPQPEHQELETVIAIGDTMEPPVRDLGVESNDPTAANLTTSLNQQSSANLSSKDASSIVARSREEIVRYRAQRRRFSYSQHISKDISKRSYRIGCQCRRTGSRQR